MIQIAYNGLAYRPQVICDVCRNPITDVHRALARSKTPLGSPGVADAIHVHKGKCDAAAAQQFGESGWTELRHHLVQIALNCGLTAESFQGAVDELRELP